MDYRQPAPAQRAAAPAAPEQSESTGGFRRGGLLPKIAAIALIVAALGVVAYLGTQLAGTAMADSAVKGKQFQAVFLTNGQVYFGKVSKVDSSYVKLSNIYYLQVSSSGSQDQVQPKTNTTDTSNQQVSLAKLGGELHGPEDAMYISRDQVLFWENLKTDGKVAKAISDYQAK